MRFTLKSEIGMTKFKLNIKFLFVPFTFWNCMKKSVCLAVLGLILTIGATSCGIFDYQPDSENYHYVQQPDSIMVRFGVHSLNDTLRFWDDITLQYDLITSPPKPILRIEAQIDGQPVNVYTSEFTGRRFIEIAAKTVSRGLHYLKLNIYLKTNSGSLADNLGMEGYLLSKEYPFYYDDRYFSGEITLQTAFNDDHLPFLEWSPYPYFNFQEYKIIRTYTSKSVSLGTSTLVDTIAIIKNRSRHAFIDSTYFGGQVRYYVVTAARGTEYKSAESSIGQVPEQLLTFENTEDGAARISWPPVPAKKGFQAYKLEIGSMKYYQHERFHLRESVLSDLQQTTFIDDKATFGSPLAYLLKIQINDKDYPLTFQYFFKGAGTEYIKRVAYIPTRDDYCLLQSDLHNTYSTFYDGTTFTRKINKLINFSPDGTWAFKLNSAGTFYRINPTQIDEVLDKATIRGNWETRPFFMISWFPTGAGLSFLTGSTTIMWFTISRTNANCTRIPTVKTEWCCASLPMGSIC